MRIDRGVGVGVSGIFLSMVLAANACKTSGSTAADAGVGSPSSSSGNPHDSGTGDNDSGVVLDDAGNPVDPVCNLRDVDINHILSTGQSNSVSNGGNPFITDRQTLGNYMFDTGVMTGGGCDDGQGCTQYQTPSSLVPLIEGDSFFNFATETMSAGLGNQVTFLASGYGLTHHTMVSLHGRSGNTYWCLRKGGCSYGQQNMAGTPYVIPFADGMRQVTDGKRLAAAIGKSYVVRAVTAIHGESDHYHQPTDPTESEFAFLTKSDGSNTPVGTYADGMIEWQRDYESSVKAITGQSESVPLFISQMSTYTDGPYSLVAQHQLEAHVRAPGKVILVGAGYPLPFAGDCLHYTAHSQRWLGAYFAKAYASTVLKCKPFSPLRPATIRMEGANTAVVKFVVPVKPMVFDTTRVATVNNYGFNYSDDSNTATINNVALLSADEVRITFSAPPTGANRKIHYAQNGQAGNICPGPTNGNRGNLRDSDPTVAFHHDASDRPYELFNWAVHFSMPVP